MFTLAFSVHTVLALFRVGTYTLQEAYNLTVGDHRPLRDDLAKEIVTLCNLVSQTSLVPVAQRWISQTLDENAIPTPNRSDSSLNDHLVDLPRRRRREDPSSRRSGFKRAVTHSHRHEGFLGRGNQGHYTIVSIMPLNMMKATPLRPPPPHPPPSDLHVPHTNPCDSVTSANAPPPMDLFIEIITAATISAMDSHLLNLGLLPRTVDAADVETS